MSKGVGVYIGHSEIIAVAAVRSAGGPKIQHYAVEPIKTDGSDEFEVGKEAQKQKKMTPQARAIRRALEKIKQVGAFVNVSLSPFDVVTRHFMMPSLPKKEEAAAIQFEASRYIPFKLAESVLDYSVHITHKNIFSITVTAARRDLIEASLDHLRSASAKVLMIEPAYCALARGFGALNMIGKSKTYGFIFIQSDGNVNVTLGAHGIVHLSRDFILSGNAEEDKTRFFEEAKASVDYFYKLTGGESIGQIFLTGSGALKQWVEHLESLFNYTIRVDVAHFPNEKDLSQEIQNAVLIAYGLAVRSLNSPSPLGGIKLLPREDRRSSMPQLISFLAFECAVVLVFFLLIRFIVFQPYLMYLENQKNQILEPMKQDNQTLATESLEALQGRQASLKSQLRQVQDFTSKRVFFSSILSMLGEGLPSSLSLDFITLESERGGSDAGQGNDASMSLRMSLKGICYLGSAEKESDVVNTWVKSLAGKKNIEDVFSEIKIEEIKRDKVQNREMTRFQILGD